MDYMTTTTLSPIDAGREALRSRRGFTLVEVLISAFIGAWILAAVLSAFLFIGRSGANIQNYNDMESQARKALEVFAEDVRQASAITWTSNTDLTLNVNAVSMRYYYDSTTKTFYRRDGGTGTTTALVTGITSFAFKPYSITGTEITALSTAADRVTANNTTKQLQISLQASRTSITVVAATNTVLSARFILRNKVVTA